MVKIEPCWQCSMTACLRAPSWRNQRMTRHSRSLHRTALPWALFYTPLQALGHYNTDCGVWAPRYQNVTLVLWPCLIFYK
jgi:hypothetical protein